MTTGTDIEFIERRGPKEFITRVPLSPDEILGIVAFGMRTVREHGTGGSTWKFDSTRMPHPTVSNCLYFQAHTTYPLAKMGGVITANCIGSDPGDGSGTVLQIIFSDNWGWEAGGSEMIIATTMKAIHSRLLLTLELPAEERAWTMSKGGWQTGVQFSQ